jgi:N-acetylglutamate synthase-like GNAT family acetyltransferase
MENCDIVQVTRENLSAYSLCGYRNPKRPGYVEKAHWLLSRMSEGLRMLVVQSREHGTQGMIEYAPGHSCWRPVMADDFMVIHCLFMGFRSSFKNKGLGSELIRRCEEDAKVLGMDGVAVVTRKGPFMVGEEIFLKRGYRSVDRAAPDFSLLAKTFSSRTPKAAFGPNVSSLPEPFDKGLVIFRADQCPYTVANVKEMARAAKTDFHITARIVDLKSPMEAQHSPCPFGTFGIFYKGKGIAHHPISAARFRNIMSKIMP